LPGQSGIKCNLSFDVFGDRSHQIRNPIEIR
jgi:hypothetical protein